MRKNIFPILFLIAVLIMSSCSYKGLEPRGNIVINVITTEEHESDEKENTEKKYFSVYSNGAYQETDVFTPDSVTEYYVEDSYSSEIVGNKIVNTVVKPTVRDNFDNLITPDDKNIINIIYAAANKIEHSIWKFKIIKDKEKYFAFVWLNVNWYSPCELYQYDADEKSIYQLCEWDSVDIAGISVPDNTNI